MEDYKTSIRPVNHPGETITVNLTLSAFTVEDLVSYYFYGAYSFAFVRPQVIEFVEKENSRSASCLTLWPLHRSSVYNSRRQSANKLIYNMLAHCLPN